MLALRRLQSELGFALEELDITGDERCTAPISSASR